MAALSSSRTLHIPTLLMIFASFITLSISVHADHVDTSMTAFQTLNSSSSSSSCFPFVMKMTICLDFLVTGSILPTPSDKCCIRLKWIGELDFPCLCNFFSGNRVWDRKVNHTRAQNLPLSCGLFGSSDDTSLKLCRNKRKALDVEHYNVRPPKSLVFDQPRLPETDNHDDRKHDEVPEPAAATAKLNSHARRLLISDSIAS